MIEQLRKLLAVREAHLQALRGKLLALQAVLARIDEEVAVLDAELQQISTQRAHWERAWQHWLHQDRMLRHGQDYNLTHVALSAWERDAQEARAEVRQRREQAANDVAAQRSLVLNAQRKVDAIQEQLQQARRRQRATREAILDSRSHDEVIAHAHFGRVGEG